MPAKRRAPWLVAILVLPYLMSGSNPVQAAEAPFDAAAAAAPGEVQTIPDFRLQSSAKATQGGAKISTSAYDDSSWVPVPARSTVLGGLISAGKYPDLNYSTNLKTKVNKADFTVPWWYRKTFTAKPKSGAHTFLRLPGGVIPSAEIWVNGVKIAGPETVAGAYPEHDFDISPHLRSGVNALAIKAFPADLCQDPEIDPCQHLSIGFLDWSQAPPDNSMGLWRDVQLAESGAVTMRHPRVLTDLEVPALRSADLTVKADLTNNTGGAVTTTARGTIDTISFTQDVRLAPHETKTVTFAPEQFGQLHLTNPKVWWPAQMGAQPLYHLALTATVDGALSDQGKADFGVRGLDSGLNAEGDRTYAINGKNFLVRGAGWEPDLFLRDNPQRLKDEFRYIRDLGLNTIRLEGKEENDEFYQLADQMGIMIFAGWECCTKWQAYDKWTEADHVVAKASATTEGLRLRNHPSILSFYVGSDTAPTPRIEQEYLDGLAVSDWDAPVITSITWRESPQLGPSGNKGFGPYWWVPPNYWYGDQRGGAFGFEAEHGPGPAIPELTALKKILSTKELDTLWKNGKSVQFHLSPSEHFDKLDEFYTALVERYGKPRDLADFVMKAQLAGYETNRAQFEAFGANQSKSDRPATGMIYWLLNNSWPSLFWHLYDYSMTPSGGYFGAKKAMRPLHVQYTYDDGMVALVNTGLTEVPGLSIQTTVLDENGVALHDQTTPATAPANGAARLVDVPLPEGVSTTYFLRLQLRDSAGKLLDRNVYWLSTKPDTVDYEAEDWRTSPQIDYADYTGLDRIPDQKVNVKAASKATGDDITTTVTMTNSGSKVAFFLRATITKGSAEDEVAPAVWSDDYVTIWPGESTTLTAQYRRSDLGSATPTVKVGGVNVENLRVTAPIK